MLIYFRLACSTRSRNFIRRRDVCDCDGGDGLRLPHRRIRVRLAGLQEMRQRRLQILRTPIPGRSTPKVSFMLNFLWQLHNVNLLQVHCQSNLSF